MKAIWSAAASVARRRFGFARHPQTIQSGVALRLPPHSKGVVSAQFALVLYSQD